MQKQKPIKREFIALMAALMSLVALSIDAMLPALPEIGEYLGVTDLTKNQQLITMIFLGLGFGQLIFGPLSDSFGRKLMVYFGFIIFVVASIVCVTTKSFELMIIGRVFQGIGLASPRSVSIAMIRDSYSGDYMAKVLSIVVMFFILIPVVAPALGQVLLHLLNWKAIFNVNLIISAIILIWFWKRQPETLSAAHRKPFSLKRYITSAKDFFTHKAAVAFTLASGFISGSFMVYLSTSQQIFQDQYGLGDLFPYFFAIIAIAVGSATYLNSRLVVQFGSMRIAYIATLAYFLISLLYVIIFYNSANPNIYILLAFFLFQFFAVGLLFGNLRALAMEPLGHIAGMGSAINGFISTIMAVPIANYIGSYVKTSVLPLFVGFSVFGLLTLLVFMYLQQDKNIKITKA